MIGPVRQYSTRVKRKTPEAGYLDSNPHQTTY